MGLEQTVQAPLPQTGSSFAATSSAGGALVPTGRRLKILEHRVHKVEMRTKENGEQEEELVVSNLRPFTLKVGVLDVHDQPLLDGNLPLRATLLYENGLPVKQTSSSEPLLVGETDVVALQGAATFKLRITSLSSHRDKQRFRIQIEPQARAAQLGRAILPRSSAQFSHRSLTRPRPSPCRRCTRASSNLSSSSSPTR